MSRDLIRELSRRIDDLESAGQSRGARTVRFGSLPNSDTSIDDNETGSTGGGGCCCNELDCLRVPGLPAGITLTPEYYEFSPGLLLCGCTPAADAQLPVKLYDVDPVHHLVWESKHGTDDHPPMCLGTTSETVPCTVTATWIWLGASSCTGSCNFTCQLTDLGHGSGPQYNWSQHNNCSTGCGCTDPNSPFVGAAIGGSECHSGTVGTTVSTSCITGKWNLQGVDDAACNCTPDQPDFDGTMDGQTATTSCTGTKVVDSSDTLLPTFWRLTIVTALDYFGCDKTKLEFHIGL
jgi:hypothetical protein